MVPNHEKVINESCRITRVGSPTNQPTIFAYECCHGTGGNAPIKPLKPNQESQSWEI